MHDFSGNIFAVIDPNANEVVESYRYNGYGEEAIVSQSGGLLAHSAIANPWRFAEKRYDDDTQLIFFGRRWYDPEAGRWISQDPLGAINGVNLYSYLHGNPLRYLDRLGFAAEEKPTNQFEDYFYGEVESHCFCEKHRTCKRGGDIGQTASPALPKITYDDCFEGVFCCHAGSHPRSYIYDLNRPELSDLMINQINGINTSRIEARERAIYTSDLVGGINIHAVYNTNNGFFPKLLECWMGLNFIATDPVRQLHKMWNSYFERTSVNSRILVICHSQGAIHVRNALLDYPPELQQRILVVAIAPAAYIYPETCAMVRHYRAKSSRDKIPRIDKEGARRAKDTIIDLEFHPDAPWFDHDFLSPTYENIIKDSVLQFIGTNGRDVRIIK